MANDLARIVLLRHGEAERFAPRDELRRLTAHGRDEVLASARALAALSLHAPVIVSSPYLRALETAEIVAATLGAGAVAQVAGITPDDDPRKAIVRLESLCRPGTTLVAVTHMPLVGAILGLLLHGDARSIAGVGTASGGLLEGEMVAPGLMRELNVIHPAMQH